ncbi:MAG: metal-dependent hydrolase [Leptospiraceae bacterium]|nr:metal-dependent hydrolase [Leptospiraceae bacterium]
MATIFTHSIVPASLGMILGEKKISKMAILLGCFLSILPDLDVIAFHFGIPYKSIFGHRGFTHSIFFGLSISLIIVSLYKIKLGSKLTLFLFFFISILSHGLLDALTNGGEGVGFFIPFQENRYFFSYRPIQVSPIGIKNFFTLRGLNVFISELQIIWIPVFLFTAISMLIRNRIEKNN